MTMVEKNASNELFKGIRFYEMGVLDKEVGLCFGCYARSQLRWHDTKMAAVEVVIIYIVAYLCFWYSNIL